MAETLICPHCGKSFEAWISQASMSRLIEGDPDGGQQDR